MTSGKTRNSCPADSPVKFTLGHISYSPLVSYLVKVNINASFQLCKPAFCKPTHTPTPPIYHISVLYLNVSINPIEINDFTILHCRGFLFTLFPCQYMENLGGVLPTKACEKDKLIWSQETEIILCINVSKYLLLGHLYSFTCNQSPQIFWPMSRLRSHQLPGRFF